MRLPVNVSLRRWLMLTPAPAVISVLLAGGLLLATWQSLGYSSNTYQQSSARGFRLCPRCRPVVGTDGKHHACPFAVESQQPHFDMGAVTDPAERVLAKYQRFLDWIDNVLEPAAEARQIHPCLVCTRHLDTLPQP